MRIERPIIFSGEAVRAILDGKKSQTRRVMDQRLAYRFDLERDGSFIAWGDEYGEWHEKPDEFCPYGRIGYHLWVKETWMDFPEYETGPFLPGKRPIKRYDYAYKADKADPNPDDKWFSSIFMPRRASRITLEITDIRVERLQDITEEDMRSEGIKIYDEDAPLRIVSCAPSFDFLQPRNRFISQWNALNSKRGFGWDANPWVWVVSFRRITG
jgi:hypothetical protein